MDRRFLLFIVLSFLLLFANTLWNVRNAPPKPPAGQGAAAEGGLADADAVGEDAVADAGDGADESAAADGDADDADAADATAEGEAEADAAPADAEADVPAEFVSLGSVDPASPYRMLVTMTNLGAAVRRVELASPRYLDEHDRAGYLGHMELSTAPGDGLLVNAVGAGTPAAVAGVQVGDVLLEAGVKELAKLSSPADLALVLGETRPRNKLQLVVQRGDARRELVAELRRRPLEVIRPESENVLLRDVPLPDGFVEPPSFLLTLEQIDKATIKPDAAELPGVDLLETAWRIVDRSADAVTFERRLPERGLTVTKRYQLAKADENAVGDPDVPAYHLTLEITVANAAGEPARQVAYRLHGPNGLPIEGWWYANKASRTWSGTSLRDVLGRYFDAKPTQQSATDVIKEKAAPFDSGSMAYMGVDAQYFAAALIPVKKDPAEAWIARADSVILGPKPDPRTTATRYANMSYRLRSKPQMLAPGDKLSHTYTAFIGPKRPDLLLKYQSADDPAYTLNDFVYLGWFSGVSRAMLGLLHVFYGFVRNYGVAIVLLTVLVRLCMFPLSRGQAKSMVKMQELKPEMDRLKERYKGDQQKQAQALQQLYRKYNVNPLAGCMPMLIQLPVFVGLYRGLAVDIELRQAPLFGSAIHWVSNLAAPDMFYDWSWFMPRFISSGEGVFILPGFGPYLNLLPLVTIALFLWQQRLFMPEPTNEQAALQQKIMKYMMVFMALLFYKVPSGLCLYTISSCLWGIGERKLVPMPTAAVGGTVSAPVGKSTVTAAAQEKRAATNGRSGPARRGKAKKKR